MPLFPTHSSDPPASDFFISPWPHPITGQKWTSELVADETYRWTQYKEPATSSTTEIAWGEVTGKPTTFAPSAHTHDDRYYTESEIDTALSGKQPTGDYATNTALSSGLDGKSPTAGSTSIVTLGTVTTGTWNGTTIAVANGGTGATTAAAARNNLSAASKREYKTANFTAESYGRYVVSSGGTVVVSNPPTGVLGDPFEVVIATGNATINGVTYAASRFPIEVVCTVAGTPGTWTTPAATVTGAFNATTIGANTPGTGAFTTVTASGAAALMPTVTNTQSMGSTSLNWSTIWVRTVRTDAGILSLNDGNSTMSLTSGNLQLGNRKLSGLRGIEFQADNTYDIGATSSTLRPRDLFLARNAEIGGNLTATGATTLTGGVILPTSTTPASATAAGVAGTICRDSNYIYVCTATNTWKRVAISTW